MTNVRQTAAFSAWYGSLRDRTARTTIDIRIRRVTVGLLGDAKALGGGLHELRIDRGPGYRVYFAYRGPTLLLLLCGGDKGSQALDILRARRLNEEEMR